MSGLYDIQRRRERAVGEALRKCAPKVERLSPGAWRFALSNGVPHGFTASIVEGWLLLDAAVGKRIGADGAWSLIKLNAGLAGVGKFALDGGHARLRAELPLDEEIDLAARLGETCAGVRAALRRLHGEGDDGEDVYPLIRPDSGEIVRNSLRELCEEAGWVTSEKDGGRLAVALEGRDLFQQALIEQTVAGSVSVAVNILPAGKATEQSRRALALLLLAANACVRMARSAIEEGADGASSARFEIGFASTPSAVELGHALSALSVACEMFGREALSMRDARVAAEFLSARGSGQMKKGDG